MRKFLNIIIIASMLTFTSCALFRNPFKDWNKATDKQAQVEKKIEKNDDETVKKGINYVYANKLALDADPSTNKYHHVESMMTDKALLTLGPPTMQDENAIRLMVSNLLSEDKAIILKGEKQLAEMDAKVIYLQEQNSKLQDSLAKAEQKVLEVGKTNSGLAQKWADLVRYFWYVIYIIIAGFVIKILAAVVPPPYNSIISIISLPLGLVIKGIKAFVPEATEAAGVIASKTYENTQLALKHVVESIEEHKKNNPEEAKKLLAILTDTTSKEVTRPIIDATRKELGY
jgi:hypothetical protein